MGRPKGSQQLLRGVTAFLPSHGLVPLPGIFFLSHSDPLGVPGTVRASLPQGGFRAGGQGQALTLLLSDQGFPLLQHVSFHSHCSLSLPRGRRLCHLSWHAGDALSWGRHPHLPAAGPLPQGCTAQEPLPGPFHCSSAFSGVTALLGLVLSRTSAL